MPIGDLGARGRVRASVAPEVPEPIGGEFAVPDGMPIVLVAEEVVLQRVAIDALVGKLVAGRVTQHAIRAT